MIEEDEAVARAIQQENSQIPLVVKNNVGSSFERQLCSPHDIELDRATGAKRDESLHAGFQVTEAQAEMQTILTASQSPEIA